MIESTPLIQRATRGTGIGATGGTGAAGIHAGSAGAMPQKSDTSAPRRSAGSLGGHDVAKTMSDGTSNVASRPASCGSSRAPGPPGSA